MENTKRDLSLDFTKPRVTRGGQNTTTLFTPNINTPELNKLISGEQEELALLTPNGISSVIPQTPTVLPSPLIPTTVNCNIINSNNNNHSNNNNNISNNTSTNNHASQNNNVNSTNNLQNSNKCNGIIQNGNQNHNSQNHKKRSDKSREADVDKIEKKRERNRLAAKKCRQRKLETIEDLRKTVSEWEQKYRNLELAFEDFKNRRAGELEALRRENIELKSLLTGRQ